MLCVGRGLECPKTSILGFRAGDSEEATRAAKKGYVLLPSWPMLRFGFDLIHLLLFLVRHVFSWVWVQRISKCLLLNYRAIAVSFWCEPSLSTRVNKGLRAVVGRSIHPGIASAEVTRNGLHQKVCTVFFSPSLPCRGNNAIKYGSHFLSSEGTETFFFF